MDNDIKNLEEVVEIQENVSGLEETQEEAFEEQIENAQMDLEGTELESYESANLEEIEFIETEHVQAIIEGILFASDRPVSLAALKTVFKGTNVRSDKIRRSLDTLAVEYAGANRGICLEEVNGGYQIRTKMDHMKFLKRLVKARSFRLSGPALEVLSIVAYKQPLIKHQIDEIRGVESGHLLRALMEKGLVHFDGKSDLPGKPMQYSTTKKFLEIFGLRNLQELPSLSEIDELLPDGIGDENEIQKMTLSDIAETMAEQSASGTYSQGEEELNKISDQLEQISTTTNFFEEEKVRMREKRDAERAQDLMDAQAVSEPIDEKDLKWLAKYKSQHPELFPVAVDAVTELQQALAAFETDEDQPKEI